MLGQPPTKPTPFSTESEATVAGISVDYKNLSIPDKERFGIVSIEGLGNPAAILTKHLTRKNLFNAGHMVVECRDEDGTLLCYALNMAAWRECQSPKMTTRKISLYDWRVKQEYETITQRKIKGNEAFIIAGTEHICAVVSADPIPEIKSYILKAQEKFASKLETNIIQTPEVNPPQAPTPLEESQAVPIVFEEPQAPATPEELPTSLPLAEEGIKPITLSDRTEYFPFIPDLDALKGIAATRMSVFITGETGTGKELLARFIHGNSSRADKPYFTVNCAALVDTLFESELFGHERGSFTGAHQKRQGFFEKANGGTLFLDELAEMPREQQVKLLRVLQQGEIMPVGNSKATKVDVRIIAATNHDTRKALESGKLRQDLFFRVSQETFRTPALREHKEHLPALAEFLIPIVAKEISDGPNKIQSKPLSKGAINKLLAHDWPGNIRELKAVLAKALVESKGAKISAENIVIQDTKPPALLAPLETFPAIPPEAKPIIDSDQNSEPLKRQFRKAAAIESIRLAKGNMTLAAKIFGSERTSFYKMVRDYKIDPKGCLNSADLR